MNLASLARSTPLKKLVEDVIYDYAKATQQLLVQLMAAALVDEGSSGPLIGIGQIKLPQNSSLPREKGNDVREYAGQNSTKENRTQSCLNSFDNSIQNLLEVDLRLRDVIKTVKEHQRNQVILLNIQSQTSKEAASIQAMVEYLQESKRNLNQLIDEAHRKMDSYRQASTRLKDPKALLGYSSRIRKNTAAPPNYDPSISDMIVEPPYPDELLMRNGILADVDANKLFARAEEALGVSGSANSPVVFHFVPPVNQASEVKSGSQFLSPGGTMGGTQQSSAVQDTADDEDFFFDLNADLE